MTPSLDRLRSFCASHGMATEKLAEIEWEVRTIAATQECPVEYVAWQLYNGLRRSFQAMHDFTEAMERIRTTPEQWDELAQRILALAESPATEITGEIVPNEQTSTQR